MYAIIESGSKQYRVEPNDALEVELLDVPIGETLQFDRVLFLREGDVTQVGRPTILGAVVRAEHMGIVKGEKLINFKFKRRKNQRRKKGHRQHYSKVRILDIAAAEEVARGA